MPTSQSACWRACAESRRPRYSLGGLEVAEAFEDGLARERRNPETLDRLAAARERVDEVEDQLALAPRVGRVDDRGHVLAPEQLLDDVELVARPLGGVVLELFGDDGQVSSRQRFHAGRKPPGSSSSTRWPTHQVTMSALPFDEAFAAAGRAERRGHVAPHRRFLGDNQAHEKSCRALRGLHTRL